MKINLMQDWQKRNFWAIINVSVWRVYHKTVSCRLIGSEFAHEIEPNILFVVVFVHNFSLTAAW